jgi:hypothetical protein
MQSENVRMKLGQIIENIYKVAQDYVVSPT